MANDNYATEERCNCGGLIIFDDDNGVARCPDCGSRESYTVNKRFRVIPPTVAAEEVGKLKGAD